MTTYVWGHGPSTDTHHLYKQGPTVWESYCILGMNVGHHDLKLNTRLSKHDLCPTCAEAAGIS